jgi:hypothetical protein
LKRFGQSTVGAALVYQHATVAGDARLAERMEALDEEYRGGNVIAFPA